MYKENKTVVISVGGSLVVPEGIDVEWITQFRTMLRQYCRRGYRFALVVGGGSTARRYQEAAKTFCQSNDELDWLGIHATRINAYLIKTILGVEQETVDYSMENIAENIASRDLAIVSGWRPGFSTDYVAVMVAQRLSVHEIINLTNIGGVYDRDPEDRAAKRLQKISWIDFRRIVGDEWLPGAHAPFDPVASELAEHLGMIVAVLDGRNLENFKRYLEGERFDGTAIGKNMNLTSQ